MQAGAASAQPGYKGKHGKMMEKETRSKFDNSRISCCPHCGRKPFLKHTVMFHDGKPYFASCENLLCVNSLATNGHETLQGAIDEWERLCEDARKIELEPCPLCGHKPALYRTDWGYKYRVYCFTPYCPKIVTTAEYETAEEAVAAWNRGDILCERTPTPKT